MLMACWGSGALCRPGGQLGLLLPRDPKLVVVAVLLQVCSNTATIESNRVRIRHTKPQETAGSYAPCPTGPVCGRVHGSVAQLVGVPIGLC